VSDSNVIKLAQPGAFTDSLTEILRSGARALLTHWSFWLSGYNTGDDVQWWYLGNPAELVFSGSGRANEIVHQVVVGQFEL
jgi:hypothetical protein